MQNLHRRADEFRKVPENLYRYSSNGIYYARFRYAGKEIQKSLKTDDRDLAKRRLKEELDKADKVDLKHSKMSLEELLRLYEDKGRIQPREIDHNSSDEDGTCPKTHVGCRLVLGGACRQGRAHRGGGVPPVHLP